MNPLSNPLYSAGVGLIVPKTANEVVNNSDALQDDDELFFPIAANEVWEAEFIIYALQGASNAPNFKYAITTPALSTVFYWRVGPDDAGTLVFQIGIASGSGLSADLNSGTERVIHIKCLVINGVNAGNVQLQWAQNTATAVATTVKASSNIIAHRVSG